MSRARAGLGGGGEPQAASLTSSVMASTRSGGQRRENGVAGGAKEGDGEEGRHGRLARTIELQAVGNRAVDRKSEKGERDQAARERRMKRRGQTESPRFE